MVTGTGVGSLCRLPAKIDAAVYKNKIVVLSQRKSVPGPTFLQNNAFCILQKWFNDSSMLPGFVQYGS